MGTRSSSRVRVLASLPLGKDNVHYIGDEEELEVANAKKARTPIYRFYRGGRKTNNPDHTYTDHPQLRKDYVPRGWCGI